MDLPCPAATVPLGPQTQLAVAHSFPPPANVTGMASRAHLTPVRITDKRGRDTIVYRRGAASPAATVRASVPAPAAPALPGALREPKPLTTAELEAFTSSIARNSLRPIHYLRAMVITEPDGRTAAALAAEAVESGVLTRDETMNLFLDASRQGAAADRTQEGTGPKVGALFARDLLLIGARAAARQPARGKLWTSNLSEATKGARSNRADQLETEAQLDSLAAVVEFTMEAQNLGDFTEVAYRTGTGSYRSIRSRRLDELVRERPHDLDRILAYIQGRSIHSMDYKRDVDGLREWLDSTEDTTAISEGWL